MKEKISIFAIVIQSSMSEEEKKTNDEEKTIPRPEGYTIVKYAKGWADFIWIFGTLVFLPIGILIDRSLNVGFWVFGIVYICLSLISWVIALIISEVKVNLKITDEGLEQTRISGSKQYPKRRMIKWEDMKSYHLCGRIETMTF